MLNAIVQFSLRFRGIVVALACALIAYGTYTAYQSHYDIFPEFAPPQVVIQTQAPGLSPQQVELLVTTPIENAISGVTGIDSVRSSSIQGLSVITVIFQNGLDIYQSRQAVGERLNVLAGQLPQGVQAPDMTPLTSSTSIVLVAGLTSQTRSLMDVTTAANWIVRPRLLAVPGVAKAVVHGGEVKQFQIHVRPERLVQFNLGLEDVLAAARRATGVRGAGFLDTPNQRILLQSEGEIQNVDELARTIVVHGSSGNITLGQLAEVVEAPEPPQGESSVMGRPGVLINVSSQYGANTLEVSRGVQAALADLRPALARDGFDLNSSIFRPAKFIGVALVNLRAALLIGAGLVIIVLFFFLAEWRTSLISCTAIPLSLLAAITVLHALGLGLDTMTLGGLAIAIGEVVDDAVIDVENILRRLRENSHMQVPRPVFHVVLDASIEVRAAVVYATFAVILVFLPLLTMSDVSGRLFRPLGISYICAVLASLGVALTVTPALCLLLLRHHQPREKEPPVVKAVKGRYVSILAMVERHHRLVIGSVTVLTLAGASILPFLGGDYLPQLNEGHFIVHMAMVSGTSLDESMRLGRQVTDKLLKLPYVISVAQHCGRSQEGDDVPGPHESEFEVDLKPLSGSENLAALAEIRDLTASFPGVNASVNTFLVERIGETLSGQPAAVVVNIVGDDLDLLDAKAQQVAQVLGGIRGAVNVNAQATPQLPQLSIRLRDADIAKWGFDRTDLLDDLSAAYEGEVVGQVYFGSQVFDVSAVIAPADRADIANIAQLPIRNSMGTYVPLGQLADISSAAGRYMIQHEGSRRAQTVTADVAGRDVASFVAEARQRIGATVPLSSGTYIEFTGAAEAKAKFVQELLVHSGLAALGILILLSVVMGHWRNLLLVLLNLPMALVGGVLAVVISGGNVSLGTIVGFVTLFGITLRNSIMMISHYEHLVMVENMPWGIETAVQGAAERLTPILMTALVTGMGLLPLALGRGAPGREIEGPLAIVILGGLVTSTLLNLLVLPTLAVRFGRFAPRPNDE